MVKEVNPENTSRKQAYKLWIKAPNPMVTFFRTLDVTALVRTSKRKHMKFNMLMGYCIGKAASEIKEFYILPAGDKLMQYDTLAINIIVKNKIGELSLCDILYDENMDLYNKHYIFILSRKKSALRLTGNSSLHLRGGGLLAHLG